MKAIHALIVALAMPFVTLAQAPVPGQPVTQTPARDTPARVAPLTGKAAIAGVLLDATTGAPIRRARIGLTGPIGSERAFFNSPAVQTNAEGRFEFRNLRPGGYTFTITKAGYLSLMASNNGKPIPPLEITEDAPVEKVVLRLARGGVIAGQLLDDLGDPVLGGEVRAMRYRFVNGRRQLTIVNSMYLNGATDDLGSFRLFGLEPGEYYLVGRPPRDLSGIQLDSPVIEGPAQTYYPGTANLVEARRVVVRGGAETTGIVFQLAPTRLARVRGRVITSSGDAFTGNVSLVVEDSISFSTFGNASVFKGEFDIRNVAPGSYSVIARPVGPQEDVNGEFGRTAVTVNGQDIEDVIVVASRSGTVRGRIVTDEGLPPPFLIKGFTLGARAVNSAMPLGRTQSTVDDNWRFELKGVFDRVRLVVQSFQTAPNSPSGNWTIKSVFAGGADVTDTGLEVRPNQTIDDIEITYSRRSPTVTGKLLGAALGADAWVIVFSSDESLWRPPSRFVRCTRAGPDGRYRMSLVARDDFLVVAVSGIEPGQCEDPDFLHSMKELSTRLSIAENETKTLDVKLVEWRQ